MTTEELKDYLAGLELDLIFGLDISEDLKLRRFWKDEFEELRESFLISPSSPLSSARFTLEKRVRVENDLLFEKTRFDVEKDIGNAVLALRLLKDGCFLCNSAFSVLIVLAEKNQPRSWCWISQQKSCSCKLQYSLQFEEIQELRRLVEKIQNMDFAENKNLALACQRFQRAYEEDDMRNRLVDSMIALEALFKKGGERGKKEREIAVECSKLLGKDEEQKQEIKSIIEEAHRIRNLMVDGLEYELHEDADYISDVIFRAKNCLRESIKEILNRL
jgi:hypothetical protein